MMLVVLVDVVVVIVGGVVFVVDVAKPSKKVARCPRDSILGLLPMQQARYHRAIPQL